MHEARLVVAKHFHRVSVISFTLDACNYEIHEVLLLHYKAMGHVDMIGAHVRISKSRQMDLDVLFGTQYNQEIRLAEFQLDSKVAATSTAQY